MEKYINIKNIIRIIAVVLICFFFIPTFVVSCSGEEVEVSAREITMGVVVDEEQITDAEPVYAILLLLPVIVLVLWSLTKKVPEKAAAIASTACGIIDFVTWMILRSEVYDYAEQCYGEAETKVSFLINQILLIALIVLSALVIIGFLQSNKQVVKDGTMSAISGNLKNVKNMIPKEMTAPKKYCDHCGALVVPDGMYCMKCGVQVEEKIKEIAEAKTEETVQEIAKEKVEDKKEQVTENKEENNVL